MGRYKVPLEDRDRRSIRRKVGEMPKQSLTSFRVLPNHLDSLLFSTPGLTLVLYMTVHALYTIGFVGGSNYYCFKEKVSFERKLNGS